jgi:hypothetical protein
VNARGSYGALPRVGEDVAIEPRYAAMRRAVKAIFYLQDRVPSPLYVYAEVNGIVSARPVPTVDAARALVAALEQTPGEIYVAVFDVASRYWPDPDYSVYHAAPLERAAVVGRRSNGASDRGRYGRAAATIGRLYHSVEDRADAVKQLDLDWTALFQDLASQAGELIRDPASSSGYRTATQAEFTALRPDPKKVAWWKAYAKPRFKAWVTFRSAQLGQDLTAAPNYLAFAERWQTDWSVYEEWKDKLAALRIAAQQMGFTIGVPEAAKLPTTAWQEAGGAVEQGARAVAAGIGDAWTLLKYGAWAVLGVGAIVALSSVASNLRSGKDPAEKYVGLVRGRRRAAQRALPAAAQLALAEGSAA